MTNKDKILALIEQKPMTANELANELGISYDSVAKLMTRLVRDNRVEYTLERAGVSSRVRRYGKAKKQPWVIPEGFKRCDVMSGRWV